MERGEGSIAAFVKTEKTMTPEEYWRAKSSHELLEAVSHFGDCSEHDEAIIRTELRRRGLPEPPPRAHRQEESIIREGQPRAALIGGTRVLLTWANEGTGEVYFTEKALSGR